MVLDQSRPASHLSMPLALAKESGCGEGESRQRADWRDPSANAFDRETDVLA